MFDGSISSVAEVVCAFVWLDSAEMAPSVFYGALPGVSHPMLDLGEGLLDRVEIGRVWRQGPELSPAVP
ncbi:hypothetical protein X743_19480 [Mesorhizobium sp. LNHC252B00]|nr:hypothetical protein X743_19480 [Mesorhizobium sp. LNHC252B00]